MAQYRAIFQNAYFKGLATAAVATVALAAGQAQAADTITLGTTADAAVEINVTEGNKTATASGANKFAKFVKVQKGATLTLSGGVTALGNAEINGGTLTVNSSAGDSALYLGSIKDFDSDKNKQAYEFDLKATAGSTLNLTKSNIGVKDFDITGSTINLTSGGVGGTNLTAYGAGAYQNDGQPKGLSFEASGKLTDVTANLEGGTNITAIGRLEIKGTADGKSVVNLKGLQSGSEGYTKNLAYLGGSRHLTIDNTTINVKDGVENSKGTAIVSPDLKISNSKIVIAGAHDQLTLGGLVERNNAGNTAAVDSGDYTEGSVVLNKTDITISNATGALNLGHGEHSKTEVTINGGTIDNKGVVNVYAPKVSLSAAHFDALIKGKLDVKSNSELNVAGDLDFSKALDAGALKTANLELTAGKTLKVVSDGAVTLGSAFAADKVTVEGGTLKVASGEEFKQTSGALVALNGLTSTSADNVKTFTVSGSASAATNLTLGQDASSKGTVTKIDELKVVGNTQSGALTINGEWSLANTKLTVGASGSTNLNDATVTLKDLDVQANGALNLDNSNLTVAETVKNAQENTGVVLKNNSTVSVAFAKVTSGGTADTTNVKKFALDGTSTLVLNATADEAKALDLTKVNALKSAFVGDSGLFKVEGFTATDKELGISGGQVSFTEAQKNAGLAGAYDNVTVTGVTADALDETNSWGAAKLDTSVTELKVGAATLNLHGVGNAETALVTDSKGNVAGVNLSGASAVLNVQDKGGTLKNITVDANNSGKVLVGSTLNVTENIGKGSSNLLGELNIQDKGVVKAANVYAKNLIVDGALNATNEVHASGATVLGDLNAKSLTLATGTGTVTVGNADSTGLLEVGTLNLGGGSLLLDPAFGEKASLAFVDQTDEDVVNVNGSVGVGQNAAFFGGLKADAADAQAILARYTNAKGSLSNKEGEIGALFVVNKTYTVPDGKPVLVDPSKTNADLSGALGAGQTFTLAKGAALVVTDELSQKVAGTAPTDAVIKFAGNDGKLTLEDGSLVQFDSALTADDKVNLVSGSNASVNNQGSNNISAANGLLEGTVNGTSVEFTLKTDKVRALSNMSRPVQDLVIDTLQKGTKFDKDAYGAQYIIAVNGDQNGKTLEATSRLAVYGGVVQGTSLAQQAANDAVADRMSRSNPNGSLVFANNAQGGGLWLSPVYKSHESDSFDADGVDYGVDGDLTGLVLGADSTSESGVRVGGYFNFGSADFDGQGVGDQVSNEADYFGFGLYAGMTAGQFSLLADAGFTQVSNDIEQSINYKNLNKATADVDSTAVTLGLRGEYKLNVATMDVTPHLGVRYTRLAIDSYDTKVNGYTVASTDFDTMQMFSIPFGVTVSKDIAAGAWTIKPVFDLTLTANAGDTDAKLSTFYTGTRAVDLTSEAFDSFTYGATFGLDAKYGENFSIGLNTNYTGSSNADEFGVMGNARYMF